MSQWISVNDKVPKWYGEYIVVACDEGSPYGEGIWHRKVVVCAEWLSGTWTWYEDGHEYDITETVMYWMPLPEPPEIDEKECQTPKKTNADKIRNLTDEELDMFLRSVKNRARIIALGNKPELMRELVSLDWLKEECKN